MTPRTTVALVITGVILFTAAGDQLARRLHLRAVEQEVDASADLLAEEVVAVVEGAAMSVEVLASFAAIELKTGADHLSEEFPAFAEVLRDHHAAIQSVQLSRGSILEFVHPLEDNEAALGLDLLSDPDRRALLEPSITTGEMTFQGPVELVQGGTGLIVREPVYMGDGSFWGFAALVLDWDTLVALTRLESDHRFLSAIQVPGVGVAAGDPAILAGDPVTRVLHIHGNRSDWMLASQPADGWPTTAPITPILWLAGTMLSMVGGALALSLARRPAELRREVEAALSEVAVSEARFHAIFEHAGVGIIATDPMGRTVSANPRFCAIVGATDSSEITGTRAMEFVHPEDRRILMRALRNLGDPIPAATEIRVGVPGDYRRCRIRITVMPDHVGHPDLVVCMVADVTERILAEQALARSEQRYRELFDSVPIAIQQEDWSRAIDAIAELRGTGVEDIASLLHEQDEVLQELLALIEIRAVNPSARLFQAPLAGRAEVPSLMDVYAPGSRSSLIEAVAMVAEGKADGESVIEAEGSDGVVRALHVHWHLPVEQGFPMYDRLLVTMTDVTARRRAEESLQRLVEAKDRFVASVAHEIRTPLTSVLGFARTLVDESNDLPEEDLAELRGLVAFHAEEMSHLIEDLLVSGRSDVSEVRVHVEPIDLGGLARSVVEGTPGLDLEVGTPGGRVTALGDPIRVRQIIRNLVTNALRYGGDDVRVEVRGEGGTPVVEVSDDGLPLSRVEADRIFEPYERSSAGSAQPGSIGLGLTVSRSLAHLLGGELVLDRVDGRNVFRLSLPPIEDRVSDSA